MNSSEQICNTHNVLLVEDSIAQLRLLEALLEDVEALDIRFKLVSVRNLKSAVALLNKCDFKVILTDLSLPDSHGVNTVATLAKMAPNIPIIVLSGNDDLQMAVATIEAGADDYITKGDYGSIAIIRTIRLSIARRARYAKSS